MTPWGRRLWHLALSPDNPVQLTSEAQVVLGTTSDDVIAALCAMLPALSSPMKDVASVADKLAKVPAVADVAAIRSCLQLTSTGAHLTADVAGSNASASISKRLAAALSRVAELRSVMLRIDSKSESTFGAALHAAATLAENIADLPSQPVMSFQLLSHPARMAPITQAADYEAARRMLRAASRRLHKLRMSRVSLDMSRLPAIPTWCSQGSSAARAYVQHAIGDMAALTSLTLERCYLPATFSAALLAYLPTIAGLQYLNVSHSNIDPMQLAHVLSHLEHLSHLDLTQTRIFSGGAASLAPQLATMTNLRHLAVGSNGLRASGVALLLRNAAYSKALCSLDISNNDIAVPHDELPPFAPHLAALKNLLWLDVSNNSLGASCASAIAQLQRLQALNIADTQLEDTGMVHLAARIAHLTNLKDIDLGSNHLYACSVPMGVAALLKGLTCLRRISLAHNALGENGVSALASCLDGLHGLVHLDLSATSAGDAAVAALAPHLAALDRVQHVQLRGNGFAAVSEELLRSHLAGNETLNIVTDADKGDVAVGTWRSWERCFADADVTGSDS